MRCTRAPRATGSGSGSSGSPAPRPPPEEELELVGAAQLQARVLQPLQHPARERASARRPRVALLIPLVDRRHRPARANPRGRPPTRDRGSGACRPPALRYRGPRSGRRSPGTPRRRWTAPRRTWRPPRNAARGTTFTRVTPSGPTTASATSSTPAAPSRRATVAAVGAAAALRSRGRRLPGPRRGTQNSSRYSVRSQSLT